MDGAEPTTAALLGSIFGALTVGVLATIGFWYRRRDERKQALRAALYVLLRAWWPLQRAATIDAHAFVPILHKLFAQEVARRTGRPVQPYKEGDVEPAVIDQMSRLLRSRFLAVERPSHETIEEALTQISRYLPVAAFDILSQTPEPFADPSALPPLPPHTQARAENAIETFVLSSFLRRTEKDLRRIALRTGPLTWLAVHRKIRSAHRMDWDEVETEVAPLIHRLYQAAQPPGAEPALADPAPEHTPVEER